MTAKRILNLPNLLYVFIWLCFLLPSRYAAEMKIGLRDWYAFGAVLVLLEIIYLIKINNKAKMQATKDITGFVYAVFLVWELLVSRLNLLPYVFIPAPENVFYVFLDDAKVMLEGFASSMYLLVIGLLSAIVSAVILGTLVGWVPRLRNAIYPITKAISTVPALIYTPYVVLLMPTFKAASLFVIFLSIFWGTFIGMINNTAFVENRIINSAKVLNVSTFTILFKIIIPFNMPRIINGLPIHLSTALMTLTAAEMIGADSGMGFYVRVSLNYANYTKAIAGIIFIGIVVTGLNEVVNLLKNRFVNWEY
ncbi:MAG: ABC transporter permease subunit [Hungatella sp.]|jgi:NitT/TauT family transport system permease protein|nr:ABC transporter permease subunit [Hungatella sp.]